MTTKKDMKAFEQFIEQPKCNHGTIIGHECNSCNREMMEDFVIFNLESLTENEIAEAINEGVTTLNKVKTQMRVNALWQDE